MRASGRRCAYLSCSILVFAVGGCELQTADFSENDTNDVEPGPIAADDAAADGDVGEVGGGSDDPMMDDGPDAAGGPPMMGGDEMFDPADFVMMDDDPSDELTDMDAAEFDPASTPDPAPSPPPIGGGGGGGGFVGGGGGGGGGGGSPGGGGGDPVDPPPDDPADLTPPVAKAAASAFWGTSPLTVEFDASFSTDVGGEISSFEWQFGDGNALLGEVVTHTFTTTGTFPVTLRVTDAGGNVDETELPIIVAEHTFDPDDEVSENEARRFLWQAAWGPTPADTQSVMDLGFEGWIEAQRTTPQSLILWADQQTNNDRDYGGRSPAHIWNDNCVEGADQLRQRVAWALIQIIVMNQQNGTNDEGNGYYYSKYVEHAFGNYRDLLEFVTFSYHMGNFLTYRNNKKANPNLGTTPDENYAREIMQLFSIGLWELDRNGTLRRDAEGEPIPTYDNDDIIQFARIFTGLRGASLDWPEPIVNPMEMRPQDHEFGEKQLLDYPGSMPAMGFIGPLEDDADQTAANGMQDVQDAIDNVFYHPNCAPFVSKRLIQRLVTSNPSAAYIERVAIAFEGGGPYGNGVRGDLFATVKAILLDPEARDAAYREHPMYGVVKEPLLLRWGLYRVMDRVDRPNEVFPFRISASIWGVSGDLGQSFMNSPSVFNFYTPEDTVPGSELSRLGVKAPELKIHTDVTVMGMMNRLRSEIVTPNDEREAGVYPYLRSLSDDPFQLVDELDHMMFFGTMSHEMRGILTDVLEQIDGETDRVRTAVWLSMASPEFRVLR